MTTRNLKLNLSHLSSQNFRRVFTSNEWQSSTSFEALYNKQSLCGNPINPAYFEPVKTPGGRSAPKLFPFFLNSWMEWLAQKWAHNLVSALYYICCSWKIFIIPNVQHSSLKVLWKKIFPFGVCKVCLSIIFYLTKSRFFPCLVKAKVTLLRNKII